MLKDEAASEKLEHLSTFLHGKINKDEARTLKSQQRTQDNSLIEQATKATDPNKIMDLWRLSNGPFSITQQKN